MVRRFVASEKCTLEAGLSSLDVPVTRESVFTVERVFELANKAHSLYLARNSAERGELLKSVLLNCATDGVSLWPAYRRPFDLIFQRAKTEDWSALADDFRTFLLNPNIFELTLSAVYD